MQQRNEKLYMQYIAVFVISLEYIFLVNFGKHSKISHRYFSSFLHTKKCNGRFFCNSPISTLLHTGNVKSLVAIATLTPFIIMKWLKMAKMVVFMSQVDDIVNEICVRIKYVLLNHWARLKEIDTRWNQRCLTGWAKKRGHRLMTTILSIPNRFKKFLHWKIPWEICN